MGVKISELTEKSVIDANDVLPIVDSTTSGTKKIKASNLTKELETKIITGEECKTDEYVEGKRVYVKRFKVGALPNNASSVTIETGLNFSELFITRLEGIARDRTTGSSFPLNYANPTVDSEMIGLRCVGNSQLRVYVGSDRSSYDAYINLYYFKI